jgi:hypothetical protein
VASHHDPADDVVVFDPADPEFAPEPEAPPPGPGDGHGDLLTRLAERSTAILATSTAAQELLRAIGVAEPAVWSAFRIGAGDASLAEGLTGDEWADLDRLGLVHGLHRTLLLAKLGGLNLPTFDPREPRRVVGFVRVTPAQHKHRFATPPRGVACPADIGEHGRVVVADAPILGLKLHQAGVRGVAIAEDPAVLAELRPWLAERQVVVASHKKAGARALRDALGPLAGAATPLVLQGELALSSSDALAVLGLHRDQLITAEPKPPVDQRALHHLVSYAQGRLATAEGGAALSILGADQPELVAAYRIGYLPADFRAALDGPTRRMLAGLHVGNSLMIPALDRDGAVVDLLLRYAGGAAGRSTGLFPEPRGMLAPVIATAFDEVVVAASLRMLCRLWRQGHRNVWLARGTADAHMNADRLRESGVRVVRVATAARERTADLARVLGEAGFRVQLMPADTAADDEPEADDHAADSSAVSDSPSPNPTQLVAVSATPITTVEPITTTAPTLDLVEHDEVAGLATFAAGTAIYVAEVPWDSSSRLEVSLRHKGQVHRDRFDVAVEAQRRRFASSAALRTAVAVELIEPQLIALLDAVRALIAEKEGRGKSPALATLLPSDRAAAMGHLMAPDLLDRIRSDLDALGWVGEDEAKDTLYLAATSRKLASPLWASLMASPGAGKSHGLDLIAELTPPEELVQLTRLTDAALYYQEGGGLAHKLLVIDEADALTPEVVVALRVLKTRGALSLSHADRSGPNGQVRTTTIEARGPVAVLTSTAGKLEPQLLSRCVEVAVDETPEQTAKILAAQRRLHADPTFLSAGGRREAIVARHRTMQRLLAAAPVVVPFAERIEFPSTSVRHRREHERFLGLIESSALLHQHQRLKDHGTIIATEADFAVAARLVARQLAGAHQGLGAHARGLLDLLGRSGATTVTMEDLARLRPEWNRYTFRAALAELATLDYIASPGGGRGKRREYHLVAPGVAAAAPGVRLRAVGELAEVGETQEMNGTPRVSAG